ncbi:alpha/beta hydrolase [Cytobacillus depressus]|uniref:Alpha/beta hydrolase n=1 Tax=Cytobacillus depressus TaxID=1602942 RepID=A0A6L3V5Y9_9BACI|nr:alpha/beta hydrolase [Cytobacillus depressus]KAB2336588.1 alpha/beta hydrolase [Cytobacillus depressus]
MSNISKSTYQIDTFTQSTLTSQDGTVISYQSIGQGPSLILIHGALNDSRDLSKLAQELSDSFTVHIIDRRGRGMSGPQGSEYSINKECEDIQALQKVTGAIYVFGHSYGGLVALETARTFQSFTKIALYEPGVSKSSLSTDWDWILQYEKAMNQKDFREAFTSFVRGAGHSPLTRMPNWYAKLILRMVIRGDHWIKIKELLPSNLCEHREVKRLEGTYTNYQIINANLLLVSGEKSPETVHHMIRILSRTIPKTQTLILPKLHHLSPCNEHNPIEVARHIKQYFLS